ncbi:MAG: ABC transporter permease, partial [Gemmatimonadota bacterium]|nr:ABC transporter permease [Gemmatimonadota bacterium]
VAVFGVTFIFFGTFGSAIPAVRDARDGWLDTVLRTGYGPGRWVVERTMAGAAIDLVQLAPSLFLLLITAGGAGRSGAVLAALAGALVFANLLGLAIAAAVRSLAEAALACAAVSLLLLHFAGFFRPPAPGWTSAAALWNAYSPLRSTLAGALGGTHGSGGEAVAAGAVIALSAALAVGLAARWTGRFRWPVR